MIKLGLIGTGGMGSWHMKTFEKIPGCKVTACCDINEKRAKEFAKKFNIESAFTDVDAMLDNVDLDAVSVVTNDNAHCCIALKAIERGLHVLCEKPLATNAADAKKMARAAKQKGIITIVNFSYRNSAAVQLAHKIVKQKTLGRIMQVEASYLQSWLVSNSWGNWRTSPNFLWRLSTMHGSRGVLGDIGVHIYDLASFVAGDFAQIECEMKTFDKGVKKIGEYPLDANESFVSLVKFKDGALGVIHASRWATGHTNSLILRVFGDRGSLEIDLDKSYDILRLCTGKENIDKGKWKELKCPKTPSMQERFINCIKTGKRDVPDFDVGAKVQEYLDNSFKSNDLKKWVKV